MILRKDTPADSHAETLNAHYMGEWLDSIADTSSGMIAQTLRDALSPATLDRPEREVPGERGLWSGAPSIRRVISGPAALRDGNEVAAYAFTWRDVPGFPPTHFYNTTCRVGAYPIGATIGADTLKHLGYTTPTIPATAERAA